MPLYEYELNADEPECQMCPGRFAVLQGFSDENVIFCPHCGLPCHRVVSRVSFKATGENNAAKAAKHGLTTWKKVRVGEWEKIDGPGVDAIVGQKSDVEKIKSEKVKKIDLTDS